MPVPTSRPASQPAVKARPWNQRVNRPITTAGRV